jgi:hypothetical protein
METVFGRHQAEIRSVSGIYGSAYEGDNEFAAIRGDVEAFAREEGRRPRILVAKMGQDGPSPRSSPPPSPISASTSISARCFRRPRK